MLAISELTSTALGTHTTASSGATSTASSSLEAWDRVVQPSSVLRVNLDSQLLQLLNQARGMRRLGLSVPPDVEFVCLQETRVRRQAALLEALLVQWTEVQGRIREEVAYLLESRLSSVCEVLTGGLTNITWVNISSFTHSKIYRWSYAHFEIIYTTHRRLLWAWVRGCPLCSSSLRVWSLLWSGLMTFLIARFRWGVNDIFLMYFVL